jgi:polar amino acid transport system ATP-binding protein
MGRREALDAGHALLERFGLAGRERDYPDRLSGGQQQRVAIVRALMTKPRALLLDEVTSALDPELVGEVLGIIRELKEEGMTMLIATHEMAFARAIADHVCYLEDGRIVEHGPPERIFSNPLEAATRRFLARLLDGQGG